jgi:hypothetical protein
VAAAALPGLRAMREDGGVSELVEWLRYRLDEDERVARAAIVGGGSGRWAEDSAWLTDMLDPLPSQRRERPGWVPMITRKDVAHIARHDPARVLAEVEAKRRIVDLHPTRNSLRWPGVEDIEVEICETCSRDGLSDEVEAPCPTIRALALPYADRPGYREEWRP